MRVCNDKQAAKLIKNKIKVNIPKFGKVSILTFTDKQFANIENYFHKKNVNHNLAGTQFELF